MFAALVLLAAVSTDPASEQRTTLESYRACVLSKAVSFKKTDLSGDDPVIIGYAANYSCSDKRYVMVQATLQFLKSRHPELGEGALGKITAMFVEQQDVRLEKDVAATLGSAPASVR